ncbi:MAG: hypothetical protein J4400_03305 [Candidatus Aenigmarchaeota archaeon]|nr:hypothetical protein [Candidatus Aenigmarchaeota archaeon]
MKIIIAALVLVMLSPFALAQPVDKALLASDITSVDMLIAKAAGEKTGFPIFILENGTLTDDVKAELARLNIKTVILVGGPAVIGNETEAELEKSYTVIRLWGAERTGTSVEVARYFWTDARCAVLADDTKDSEADTELHTDAVQIAAGDCPFVPVPRGHVPDEVLELLEDLNVSRVTFMGPPGTSGLAHLQLKEITGSKSEREATILETLRNATSNGTLRLLVIAAPHWKHVLGYGGHAARHTLVRIVSSTDGVPGLVGLVHNNNITDVRIVGQPALANDIEAQLEANNITASKISGERASETALKAARESWSRWQERRHDSFENERSISKSRTKRYVTALLSKFERTLDRMEASISTNSTAAALLQNRIDRAQSQIGAIKDYISNDNLETARTRMASLSSEVRKIRWLYRMELRVDARQDVSDEES